MTAKRYAILGVSALGVFHALYISGAVPAGYINLALVIAAPICYFVNSRTAYRIMIASWAVLGPLCFRVYSMGFFGSAVTVFSFNALQAGFVVYRQMIELEKNRWDAKFIEDAENKKNLEAEFAKFESFEKGMKHKELATANIYEITRKMSESMTFTDIFKVFSAFLVENFVFRNSELLILARQPGPVRVEKCYSVWHDGFQRPAGEASAYEKLADFFEKRPPAELYVTRQSSGPSFADLGVQDSQAETITAIPILSEKSLAAILVVENLPRQDLEKLAILALQFALEMKKVLLYETVETLAVTDSLTGLYVRRYFLDRLAEELKRSKSYKYSCALLMVDIDNFKQCNDTYGHLVGDAVLKEMGRMVRQSIREIDLSGRYGGEEFAVMLPETNKEGAMMVAERLRKRIAENVFKAYDETLRFTVSIGIAAYPADATEMKFLIERSDKALYSAKRSGKNVVCLYKM